MNEKMGGDLESKFAPKKALEVSVAAPDKASLADGLEHAHELASGDVDDKGPAGGSDESDEDRLMALLGDDGEDDEDKHGIF
jgi:hypothetical protein